MEYFNLLPEEITLDIISRVPAESVLECKLVCTNWRCLVGHPSFSKMHLDHLNHPATDSGELNFIAFTSSDWWTNYNFRYFEYDENHESIERIRRLNVKIPFGWGTIFVGSCNGLICCYSSPYIWICNPMNREYILLPEINRVGMYYRGNGFDYVSSTNEYNSKPAVGGSPPEYEFDYDSKLWVLDGCLSFVISGLVDEAVCSDVWLSRNKDDNHGMIEQEGQQSIGWSEVFRVFDSELFAVTKSYSVLTYKGNHINIHDPKASTSETIVVFEGNIGVVFPHKNTFVSLKELGEEDTKMMESVEIQETESHDHPFNQL